jgi:DNA-binding MarR family transcriptional regulator
MAKMTVREAADRAALDLRDATSALARVTRSGGIEHLEAARDATRSALARIMSATAAPVSGPRALNPAGGRYSASLALGLIILEVFPFDEEVTLGIADVADRLEMSRSTVHRYVITLVAMGQLEQVASRKYRRPQVQRTASVSSLAAQRARRATRRSTAQPAPAQAAAA